MLSKSFNINNLISLFLLLVSSCFSVNGQLHFASLGNWGLNTSVQSSVANVLKLKSKEFGMSFIVSPGSNFKHGIESLDDPRWTSEFTKIYAGKELHLPFFTVLGSEDWTKNYSAEIDYNYKTIHPATPEKKEDSESEKSNDNNVSELGPIWTIPNWWYHYSHHFTDSSVLFIFIDTYIMSNSFPNTDLTKLQWDYLKTTVEIAVTIYDWVIVIGDKSIMSSGKSKTDNHLFRSLRQLLKENKVDAYISGRDFDMEIIEDGDLSLINCGTAAGSDHMVRLKMDHSVYYTSQAGFCHHKVTKKEFITEFIDGHTGEILHRYTKKTNSRQKLIVSRFNLYKSLPKVEYIPCSTVSNYMADENNLFLKFCGTSGLGVFLLLTLTYVVSIAHKVIKS